MEPHVANPLDHYKLGSFFQEIMVLDQKEVSDKDFGEQLLTSLSQIFGYNTSAFWLYNPECNTYTLVSHRVESNIIENYAHEFYKLDPFYPDNLIKRKANENVLTLKDIMSYDEYHASPYYTEFISKTNMYYYETVIYLRYKGAIIGGIGFLRSKQEGDFSCNDINIMKIISTYVSKLAANYMLVNDLRNQSSVFESFCNQSPVGLIIFEAHYPYRIHYINSAAWRYTSELSPDCNKQNHAEQFIKQHIASDFYYQQFGLSKTLYSRSSKKFTVNAVPSQAVNKYTFWIYVYIVPQSEPEGVIKHRILNYNSNLTDRQLEIIDCVLQGKSNEEIAKELFISVSTVKTHLNNIYKELKVTNRLSLYSELIGNSEKK